MTNHCDKPAAAGFTYVLLIRPRGPAREGRLTRLRPEPGSIPRQSGRGRAGGFRGAAVQHLRARRARERGLEVLVDPTHGGLMGVSAYHQAGGQD
jgi:hypothetical protein